MITWEKQAEPSKTLVGKIGPAKFSICPAFLPGPIRAGFSVLLRYSGEEYAILFDPDLDVCKRFAIWVARAYGWDEQ